MAVAPHGTPTHLGYGSHTNPSLSEPTGASAGDVLLLLGVTFNGSGAAPVPSLPAGWSPPPRSSNGLLIDIPFGSGHMSLWAWTKTSTGSGTDTITVSGSSDFWMGAYSGVDTTTPIPSNWRHLNGTGGSSGVATVNTHANGAEIVVVGGDNGSTANTLSISGSTPTFTAHIASQGVFSVFDGNLATQGATGFKTFTNNNTPSSGEGWLTATLILNPPGAGSLSYDDLVLNDSPVCYYPLGETTGTTAFDFADGINGTYEGSVLGYGVPGIGDGEKALSLNGVDQDVSFAQTPLWNQIQQNYTLEIWMKLHDLLGTFGIIVNNGNVGPGNFLGFGMIMSDGAGGPGLKLFGTFPGKSDFDSGYTFADTRWHHLALVNTSGTSRIWVDGVIQSGSSTVLGDQNSNNARIGYYNGQYLKATLAKAGFYDYPLTGTQIATHINSVPVFVELDALMTMYANATIDGYNIGHATLAANMTLSAAAGKVAVGASTPEAPVSGYFAR